MAIQINTMEDLTNHSDKLSPAILEDINKRLSDWLGSGGKETDPYIHQQFRYAENFLNRGQ